VIRLALRVPRAQAEVVLAAVLELAPAGVEEVQLEGGETIEYAVYGAPGELPALPDLTAAVGQALVEITTSELADDWSERWKEFHRPVLIAAPAPDAAAPGASAAAAVDVPSLRIRPPWEPAAEEARSVREIVIDPGQAFGTGGHASTRLCISLMLELAGRAPERGPLLDVGTGSGVLAIAAAMLGYEPVLGLDNEAASVIAAAENALVNGVQVEARRFDMRHDELPWRSVAERPAGPLSITANLLRPLLLELALRLPEHTAELIAGGLLREEADEVSAALAAGGPLRERRRLEEGEWAALWLSAAG
jgi:ribosomal protein L11 methyltransferase